MGLVIYLVVTKNIASYKSEIIVPDVVYLEESSNISVIAQGKKNTEKTVTKFSSSDEKIVSILEESMVGENVLNKFIENLSDIANLDKKPKLEGKNMFIMLSKKV